jgi:hypothetical protein
MAVGTLICRSGQSSGYTCGTVRATNTFHIYTDLTLLNHLWETDFTSIGGDSGGTIMANTTIGGIQSGVDSGHTLYSTVATTTTNMGVRPCLASTC